MGESALIIQRFILDLNNGFKGEALVVQPHVLPKIRCKRYPSNKLFIATYSYGYARRK